MKEVRNLSEQLEQHRKSLRDVNNSLKRLSGRVKTNGDEENRSFSNKRGDQQHQRQDSKSNHRLSNSSSSSHSQSNRHEKNNVDLKRLADEATQRVLKRKMIDDDPSRYNPKRTMFDRSSSRTSEHDDYEADPRRQSSIRSSVVSKNIKTREDLIQLQTKHNGSEQRNRRMIGLLVGTLREFKSDDTERSQTKQALDRKELEKKIEEKKLEEKQKMLEERRKLEQEKYKSIRNIKILEKKIDLTQAFEDWEKNQRRLRHFLRTKTEPAIFFLPRLLRPDTQSLLESNALLVEQQIAAKRSELDRELDTLTQESAALMASDDFIAVDNEEDGDGDDEDEVWEEATAEDKDAAAVKQTDELLDKEPNDVQLEETGDEVTTDQTTTNTTAVIADEK